MKNLVQIFLFLSAMILLSTACEHEIADCIDPAQINLEAVCTGHYDPVCGCNDVSYSNECVAEASGVISWKLGLCQSDCIDESLIDHDASCFTVYDPVCGCDDVTYSNECVANAAGVTIWESGVCP